ncbi:MAG: cytidine deaminase [Metamycoplasmataceae bacterium]
MLEELIKLANNSYSKYSNFRVACIIELKDKLIKGVNVENVSYPNSTCAERSAISVAYSLGINLKEAIRVHVFSPDSKEILPPCGSCRQNLAEHLNYNIDVVMYSNDGNFKVEKLSNLIPYKVELKELKVN